MKKKPNKKQPTIKEIKEESFVNLSVAVEEGKPQQNEKDHVHSDSCSHPVSFMGGFSIGEDGKLVNGKGGKLVKKAFGRCWRKKA